MIISHSHRFIFIHCRKAAGSSISAFLSSYLGPRDLMIGNWPEAYEYGTKPNARVWLDLVHPRSLKRLVRDIIESKSPLSRKTFVTLLNNAQKEKYKRVLGGNPPHPLARQIRTYAKKEWDRYYKFCFVRNPYDIAVSDYLWRKRVMKFQNISFRMFLEAMTHPELDGSILARNFDNWQMYTIDNEVCVDTVYRFEELQQSVDSICDRLNLDSEALRLPHAKKRGGPKTSYRAWYSHTEKKNG